jgi:hypothetical protein
MKNKFLIFCSIFLFATVLSCTDDFNEINEQPDALSASDVSAKYFVTDLQQGLWGANTFGMWLGNILHADLFSGHSAQGFAQSDWNGDAGWVYSAFWQGFTYSTIANFNSPLTSFTNLVKEGGSLENDQFYAIALIMKGSFYQQFTDMYGMLPYSEASDPTITTPKYDEQIDIYRGVIAELDQAIALIGSNTKSGEGVELLGENDVIFGGDMQKWKQLANSLKLRMALRAHGSPGENFSANAASEAIASGVLGDSNALFTRDTQINQWTSAAYGDIWATWPGSRWNVGEPLINILNDNNDPRLSLMTQPSKGGVMTISKPTDSNGVAMMDSHLAFLKNTLDKAGATYTMEDTGANMVVTMPANTNYVGLPMRLSDKIKRYFNNDMFAIPAQIIIQGKNEGKPIFPHIVMSAGESHLMVAQAIVKGLASGDAASHYQLGIQHAMGLWGADASAYLASDMGTLSGSNEEKIEKIATQRWIANYTNGWEAWSIVRKTGYPKTAYSIADPSTSDIISLAGDLNGEYPGRLRYGDVYGSNGPNTQEALSKQGPDVMSTKLWWSK